MKLKVKFFKERELNELEAKINEFIQSDECKMVVNIQYGTDGTMVVYSDQEPEEPTIIINNDAQNTSTSKEGE
ncbi:MAG: hypothetical protein IKC22_00890 [Bacilli bacterium]|nr:hypothetical protein [bacterium]MBR2890939.1 hypothetical protein [Bacilli bacterium]